MKKKQVMALLIAVCLATSSCPAYALTATDLIGGDTLDISGSTPKVKKGSGSYRIEDQEEESPGNYTIEDETDLSVTTFASNSAATGTTVSKVEELVAPVKEYQDLNANNFNYASITSASYLKTGDIAVLGEDLYVYIKLDDGSDEWWKITSTGTEVVTFAWTADAAYYRKQKETPTYTVPTGLTVNYNSRLSTVTLPDGFAFSNPDLVASSVGPMTAMATYTPANDLIYSTAYVNLDLTVVPAPAPAVTQPESSYEITWYDKITLEDIKLPQGWTWDNPTTAIEVGITKYTASYGTDPNYSYSDSAQPVEIDVKVNKVVIDFGNVKINATKGNTLTDTILPKRTDGTLSWKEQGKTAEKSGVFYANFTAADPAHYEDVADVPINVTVSEASGGSSGSIPGDSVDINDGNGDAGTDDTKAPASNGTSNSSTTTIIVKPSNPVSPVNGSALKPSASSLPNLTTSNPAAELSPVKEQSKEKTTTVKPVTVSTITTNQISTIAAALLAKETKEDGTSTAVVSDKTVTKTVSEAEIKKAEANTTKTGSDSSSGLLTASSDADNKVVTDTNGQTTVLQDEPKEEKKGYQITDDQNGSEVSEAAPEAAEDKTVTDTTDSEEPEEEEKKSPIIPITVAGVLLVSGIATWAKVKKSKKMDQRLYGEDQK